MRYKQQVEDYLSKKVETMLSTVIGPGNAVVRVSAEIDTEATTTTAEKWNPEGQVVRSQTQTEDTTNSSESRAAGGATGVSANIPEKSSGNAESARPVSTSEQNRKNKTTTYEIDRTTTNITRNPGSVKNVTAAVFIAPRMVAAPIDPAAPKGAPVPEPQPQKRSQQELDALRQVVINALGLKPAAGQSLDSLVSLQETPFQSAVPLAGQLENVTGETRLQSWFELASKWAAFVGAAFVLLIFWRTLSKQKIEAVPVDVLSMTPDAAQRSLPNPSNVTPELLNELIRQKPANIGVALRDWVTAGNVPAGKN
jgi:flagellar M-ring protein FliF